MVIGLESFKAWFGGYEDQYAIIGGTACDLLMAEEGINFRATKDIDLVLIVEALTPGFGRRFWEYIVQAGYEYRNKSTGRPQFYRFSRPTQSGFPHMIEIFSRQPEAISLPDDAVLTPLPMEDDISSLSAILLDDEYYALLSDGRVIVNGIPVLDVDKLILFKVKAWLDLSARKAAGEPVDSKNIRKHKNDVFRLSMMLTPSMRTGISNGVYTDFHQFLHEMETETMDLKQLGILRSKDEVLKLLDETYYLQKV